MAETARGELVLWYDKITMFNFNKIIRVLITSDLVISSAWGLVSPIIAVFVVQAIRGGDASVVGIASGVYWILKSLLQIPIGKYLDRNHGEKDDYWFMVIGTFIAGIAPLLYLVASQPLHVYGIEALHAVAMAMAIPSWGGIFTRHMDKGREAETWSFESSAIGLGAGAMGIVGGFVAKFIGFAPLFIGVSFLATLGGVVLLFARKEVLPRDGRVMPVKREIL